MAAGAVASSAGASVLAADVLRARTCWEVLQLGGRLESLTDADVRAAYKRLALQLHPDKSGGAKGADQAFIRVGEAFERLRDGSGRAAYGAELAREPAGSLLRRQKSAERFTEEAEHLRRELRRWKEEWAQGSSLGTPGSAQRKAAFGRSGSGERAGSLPHELLAGAIFTVRERGRAGEPPQESSVWLSGDGVTLNWRSVNSAGHRPDGFWDLRTLTAVTRLKPGPGQGDLPVSLSLTRKDGSVHVLTAEHSDVCASWHKALKSLLAPPSAT